MIAERLTCRVRISNQEGMHLRTAALFCQVARAFACDIRITYGERHADAKSVWEFIGLMAEPGTELVIEAKGSRMEQALDRLEGLVVRQFQVSAVENCHETV